MVLLRCKKIGFTWWACILLLVRCRREENIKEAEIWKEDFDNKFKTTFAQKGIYVGKASETLKIQTSTVSKIGEFWQLYLHNHDTREQIKLQFCVTWMRAYM